MSLNVVLLSYEFALLLNFLLELISKLKINFLKKLLNIKTCIINLKIENNFFNKGVRERYNNKNF